MATWVATPELYTTELRATGHSSCNAVSKMCSFFSPYLISSALPPITIGIVLAVLNLLAAATAQLLPETTQGFILVAQFFSAAQYTINHIFSNCVCILLHALQEEWRSRRGVRKVNPPPRLWRPQKEAAVSSWPLCTTASTSSSSRLGPPGAAVAVAVVPMVADSSIVHFLL